MNVDLAPSLMGPDMARFIKNLVYSIDDVSAATISKDAATGVFKTMQSVNKYINDLKLPVGVNQCIGTLTVKELRQVFAFIYNDQKNHTIYRLNGVDATYNIVDTSPCYNFQLDPIFFFHQAAAILDIIYVADPVTGAKIPRTFLMFTDGFNRQWNLAVEDSIATNGFDKSKFPYFNGDYDPCVIRSMGVPSPKDCIDIKEVPRTAADKGLNNNIIFNTWQFRLMDIDVWGRPSEHGIISKMYVPGVNDCIGANSGIPRCLDLTFEAPNPTIDKIQVEYRNCNDNQWYVSDTLFLYNGSSLGQWWLRPRNEDGTFSFNADANTITYRFCRDKECRPVPQTETVRVANPLPRTSVVIAGIGRDIALANNKDGFPPFTQDLRSKFKITVEPPAQVQINTANITVYIPIYNHNFNNYQAVIKDGSTGYVWGDNNPKHGGARAYSQFFTNPQQSGFGGYLVGTGNYVISTQWYLDSSNVLQPDTDFQGVTLSPGKPIFQKFEFTNIPKGNYIFRLFSHLSDPATDPSYTATSTTVWGLCPFNGNTKVIDAENRKPIQELLINVCNGDYNTLTDTKILVIADLAFWFDNHLAGGQKSRATSGYVYETRKNGSNQFPVELISVSNPVGATSIITDHNGFYWFFTKASGRSFAFKFQYKCAQVQFNLGEGGNGMTITNIVLDEIQTSSPVTTRFPDYSTVPCNRVLIKGKVLLTGTNIPVSNVTVVLTRGQFATTDSNGEYSIVAHDDNTIQPRSDIIVLASGACAYTGPDGSCIPTKPIQFYDCHTCVLREIDISDFILSFISGKGLLSGGTYGWSVIGKDWMDRPTFAQPLGYFGIPSIIDSKAIAPSKVRVGISVDAVFPDDIDHITFAITSETTIDKYIDWIVDKAELVDNTGAINNAAPTQIKIYYASLLEYQKQNNYNTTVQWQFLETPVGTNPATPFTHDIVYFYLNGDGKYFPNNISALVKYDQVGQYFLIDYVSDLAGLLPNALIRLVRPKVCTGNEGYFEICSNIDIKNNSATINSFYLDAFDTYYLFRQIPVPVFVNPTNTKLVSVNTKQISNPDNSQTTVTSTTDETITQIDESRSFGFPFESDSPSNLWGKGCHNIGRPFAKNPYEGVIYNDEQIALSGAITPNDTLNFSNYFDDANKVDFSVTGGGSDVNGIVAVIPDSNRILVIGQDNNFIVGYNDNIVRVNDQGQAISPSIENKFGRPETQLSGNFGCKLFDKNTIVYYKGFVMYLDSNESSIIQNDYSTSKPFSESGADSYIRMKIKEVQDWNNKNTNKRYFIASGNPVNDAYLLTDKIIGNTSYFNDLFGFDVTAQETVSFGIFTKKFKASWGFTPEYYAYLEGDIKNKQLLSFVQGIANNHYDASDNADYGKIYGHTARRVITIVAALDNLKKKKYQTIAVYCRQGTYYVRTVTTETGQVSRILLSQFLEAEFGFYAPFLCDINTLPDPNNPDLNTLFDGNVLNGNYATITLVGDPSTDNEYTELEGIVVNVVNSEKSGV